MAKNSNSQSSATQARTAAAVRTHSRKAVQTLQTKAKRKGAHSEDSNATLTALTAFLISTLLPKRIDGPKDFTFNRDEFAKRFKSRRVMSSFSGQGDFRLDSRVMQKSMIGISADGKSELVSLISPANPAGKLLFEASKVRGENRKATRFDAIIDALAYTVVDMVAGIKESAPVNGETEEEKKERNKRNSLIGKQRKVVIGALGLFPSRARNVGNKDKDGNKVDK